MWEVSFVNVTMLELDELSFIEEEKNDGKGNTSSKGSPKSNKKVNSGLSYGELIELLMKSNDVQP